MDNRKDFQFLFCFYYYLLFHFCFLFRHYDKKVFQSELCLLDNLDYGCCILSILQHHLEDILEPVRAKPTLESNDYYLCLFPVLYKTKQVSFDRKYVFLGSYHHLLPILPCIFIIDI